MALEFPQDDWRVPNNREGGSEAESEFFLLMSLALDDMLDAQEEERFQRYIAEDPALAAEWQTWQGLNARFDNEPSIAPPTNFVDNVVGQLALQESDDAHVLMSLAVDGLLDAEEEGRFNHYMENDPALANDWQVWQELGTRFNDEPSMMPPADFVNKVAAGILLQQRRSKLRLGVFVGAITTVTWLLLVFALVGAGAYVVIYQGQWLGEQIANLAILNANIVTWFSLATENVGRVLNGTVGTYQLMGIVLAYTATAAFVLSLWTRLLRRSVRDNQVGQAITS